MERKQSFFSITKIASVSVAAIFIGLLLFSSSGMDTLRSGMNQLFGSGNETSVIDNGEDEEMEEQEEIVTPPEEVEEEFEITEPFLQNVHGELLYRGVWEEAAEALILYLQSIHHTDIVAIEKYGWNTNTDKDASVILSFYNQQVNLKTLRVLDVQFSLAEPDVLVYLSYEDNLDGEEKAVKYVITNGNEKHEVYDTIQHPNEELTFNVTDKIIDAYNAFAESYSNDALSELTDVEFVTLYFYTDQLGDYETLYELHILDEEKYIFPTKDQYLREMEESLSARLADTIEKDLLAMYRVLTREESDNAGVRILLKGKAGDFPLTFQLTHEEGVWKSHWNPLQ